ncbi:MAG: phosphate/phosphite/phosphonate ABC transporter substrate-binding protein [Rhodocyclaceae bacterium]
MHFADERISVCPHDTAKNQLAWYTFNTYLQRKLGVKLHFEPQANFLEERRLVLEDPRYRLVYANPFSAGLFREQLGFIPVACPADLFDETMLVKRAGAELPAEGCLRIASATDKLIVHTLGLMLLNDAGIAGERREFTFVGSHAAAAQALNKGKADLGFVYNETWHGLNESSRKQLEVVKESQTRLAFHCFCIAPAWRNRLSEIQEILCQMHEDEKGRAILAELKFSRLVPLEENALDDLAEIMTLFA